MDVFDQRWEKVKQLVGMRPKQVKAEARALFGLVAQVRPKSFLEIGSSRGGSLYLYAGACAPGATVFTIDTGRRAPHLYKVVDELCEEGFQARWIRGSSHNVYTQHEVLAEGPLSPAWEFVHIDGDHTEAGVLQDWQWYGRLARPGGIVAFHDIAFHDGHCAVFKAWPEIREQAADYLEIIGPMWKGKTYVGIGVVWP